MVMRFLKGRENTRNQTILSLPPRVKQLESKMNLNFDEHSSFQEDIRDGFRRRQRNRSLISNLQGRVNSLERKKTTPGGGSAGLTSRQSSALDWITSNLDDIALIEDIKEAEVASRIREMIRNDATTRNYIRTMIQDWYNNNLAGIVADIRADTTNVQSVVSKRFAGWPYDWPTAIPNVLKELKSEVTAERVSEINDLKRDAILPIDQKLGAYKGSFTDVADAVDNLRAAINASRITTTLDNMKDAANDPDASATTRATNVMKSIDNLERDVSNLLNGVKNALSSLKSALQISASKL